MLRASCPGWGGHRQLQGPQGDIHHPHPGISPKQRGQKAPKGPNDAGRWGVKRGD